MGKSFEEIKLIIERVLVIPVSLASAERNFSTMKRIKIYLRTSMTTTRFHNLVLISIEGSLVRSYWKILQRLLTSSPK